MTGWNYAAANIPDGGTGADTLQDGNGTDTDVVDKPVDVVLEATGRGRADRSAADKECAQSLPGPTPWNAPI